MTVFKGSAARAVGCPLSSTIGTTVFGWMPEMQRISA
jgi:hypothetical protein